MTHINSDVPPIAQRVETAARLRAAVHASLRQGRELCQLRPQHSAQVRPMLQRLNEIRMELDRMHGLRGEALPETTSPVWID